MKGVRPSDLPVASGHQPVNPAKAGIHWLDLMVQPEPKKSRMVGKGLMLAGDSVHPHTKAPPITAIRAGLNVDHPVCGGWKPILAAKKLMAC